MMLQNIFPYFFKPQRLKYQLLLGFLIHDATDHVPVLFRVLFQTITFEISVITWFSIFFFNFSFLISFFLAIGITSFPVKTP